MVSDKQWLSRVRGLLQRHCGHFIKGRIELISAKVITTASKSDLAISNTSTITGTSKGTNRIKLILADQSSGGYNALKYTFLTPRSPY